jgi:BRO1-like domain
MKVSCTHFQCSAWAFQHLRDSFETNASPDMNYHLLSFKSHLMLVSVTGSAVCSSAQFFVNTVDFNLHASPVCFHVTLSQGCS